MHIKCRRDWFNPPTVLLAPFVAIFHAVRECSGVSTPTVSVGITKCGVRIFFPEEFRPSHYLVW